jgi:hypothetical protein
MERARRKNLHIANPVASRMPRGLIRVPTQASAVTGRLRHDRATVVKLCDMGNRQCLHLSSSFYKDNRKLRSNPTF